jgi:glycosyltransferase involved in cell wall biosynthesis
MPETEFVIYQPEDFPVAAWFKQFQNTSGRHTPLPSQGRGRKLLHGTRYWPAALASEEFDLFEVFNLPIIQSPTGKIVRTIHDIRGIRPEYNLLKRSAYRLYLQKSLSSADRVITVSEAMKQEILSVSPNVPISVVYNGIDTREFAAPAQDIAGSTRQKYRLPLEFILAVGHLEERKNYLCLLQAIAHLRDRGVPSPLVIVGNDSGMRRAIENRIAELKLTDSVTILGDLSDQEVRCVYSMSKLFVFPSLYEGFGIPILEAMASGCPMALSDIPVFREITENRGIYFSPTDAMAMALAMEDALTSSSERTRLVEYGRARVAAFSFGNLAGQLETVYRSLVR